MAETKILDVESYTPTAINDLFTVRVDKKWILFSDAYTGLYAWDSSTSSATPVYDYLPYQNQSDGSSGSNLALSSCPLVPGGSFLTFYRGRLFFVNPNLSKVYYSGTRTDQSVTIPGSLTSWAGTTSYVLGDLVSNGGSNYVCIEAHTSEATFDATELAHWSTSRAMHPWENWNLRMDLSRNNPAHGGSLVVGDPSQAIMGIWPTDTGMLVFKQSCIYLWSWSDSAAPHEVSMGASIERIVDDIGLVSYRTIKQDGEIIFFLGQDKSGKHGVYRIENNSLTLVSSAISKDLLNMSQTDYTKPLPSAIIYDDFYLLAMQENDVPALKFGYSIRFDAWYRFSGIDVLSWVKHTASGKILILHSDGHIYSFPNDHATLDFGTTDISWEIKSATIDNTDPIAEKKFRAAYVNLDIMSGDVVSTTDTQDITVTMYYPDSSETSTVTVVGRDTAVIPLTGRAQEADMLVSGSADRKIRIRDLVVGWRARRKINVQD